MQIALISDIHGNAIALRAVLADIARFDVAEILCLGDVVADGPQPNEVLAILQEEEIPSVIGNTDKFLLNPKPHPVPDERRQRFLDISLWGAEQLTDDDCDFLQSFPLTISHADYDLLCYHASPLHNEDLILPTTTDSELSVYFKDTEQTLLAGGHIHMQMRRRWGKYTLINSGSVGLAWIRTPDGNTKPQPYAEYALVERDGDLLNILFRQVAYNIPAFHAEIRSSGMPHADWLISRWH